MVAHGFQLAIDDLSELELGYIGGLLKLDLKFDQDPEIVVREQLAGKRGPSSERKG